MLRISELYKSYKGFNVLRGLNMSISKGDVYGFIGRNGCGKTTTMNIICDILPKDKGEIVIGENGDKVRIGYLPETPALFGYMNGYEYLDYIAACSEFEGDIKYRTAETLDIVGLTDGANRRIKGYSRGMNQRLGIAAAIYANPDLLILDEPTSALDPEGRAEVMEIIQRLKQMGTTILLCTHILTDIERVANKIGILSRGIMADEGRMDEVINRHSKKVAINIKMNDKIEEAVSALRSTEIVANVEIDGQTGELTVSGNESTNIEALYTEIMKKMIETKITPEAMSTNRPNLEQIYLKIAGEERNSKSLRKN